MSFDHRPRADHHEAKDDEDEHRRACPHEIRIGRVGNQRRLWGSDEVAVDKKATKPNNRQGLHRCNNRGDNHGARSICIPPAASNGLRCIVLRDGPLVLALSLGPGLGLSFGLRVWLFRSALSAHGDYFTSLARNTLLPISKYPAFTTPTPSRFPVHLRHNGIGGNTPLRRFDGTTT